LKEVQGHTQFVQSLILMNIHPAQGQQRNGTALTTDEKIHIPRGLFPYHGTLITFEFGLLFRNTGEVKVGPWNSLPS
jgi:hypothetical protein